jgi:hypothetical protein
MMTVDGVEEIAMAAEMSNAEALEPQSLAEACRCGDWPLWETAIKEELVVLGAQGFLHLTARLTYIDRMKMTMHLTSMQSPAKTHEIAVHALVFAKTKVSNSHTYLLPFCLVT